MTSTLMLISSYSIIIAVIIGLIRLPTLDRSYQPFFLIVIASFVNETISSILIRQHNSNAPAVNIFGLFDAILWSWQFRSWNMHYKWNTVRYATTIALIIMWITENIMFRKIFSFSLGYPIALSVFVIIFSTIQLSRAMAQEKEHLFMEPKFLICFGALLFYTFRVLVECLFFQGDYKSVVFFGNVFNILLVVNLIVNLLFALAVLWIPEKQKFSVPYY